MGDQAMSDINKLEHLIGHYAEATEWNLATLEELRDLRRSSASAKRRQAAICRKMLHVCIAHKSVIVKGTKKHQVVPPLRVHRVQTFLHKIPDNAGDLLIRDALNTLLMELDP
jgi:hypothetical protein